MICQRCQYDNKGPVPFCDQCGVALFETDTAPRPAARRAPERTPPAARPDNPDAIATLQLAQAPRPNTPETLPELALALVPLETEPTEAQIKLLSEQLSIGAYDARRLAGLKLPRIVLAGTMAELHTTARVFEEGQIPFLCLGPETAFAACDLLSIDALSAGREGHVVLRGGDEIIDLDLRGDALIVLGRDAEPRRPPTRRQARGNTSSFGGRGGTQPKRSSDTRRHKGASSGHEFVQLWLPDHARAYELRQQQIHSYDFLGDAMTASADLNFRALVKLLSSQPGVTVDETLRHTSMSGQELLRDLPATLRKEAKRFLSHHGEHTGAARFIARLIFLAWY